MHPSKFIQITLVFFFALTFAREGFTQSNEPINVGAPASFRRISIVDKPVTNWVTGYNPDGTPNGLLHSETSTQSEFYFGPLGIVPIVTIPLERRAEFQAGLDFGACYGPSWSPRFWSEKDSDPFLSLGLCLKMGLHLNVEATANRPEGLDTFRLSGIAGLGFLGWGFIGFGYEHRMALSDGARDFGTPIISAGIMKTL